MLSLRALNALICDKRYTKHYPSALGDYDIRHKRILFISYNRYLPRPANGTIASEWSDVSKLNPLIAVSMETMTKELYGEQVLLSGFNWKPVAQAQEKSPPGTGRHSCWQVPMLLLQPFEEPTESKAGKDKRIYKLKLTVVIQPWRKGAFYKRQMSQIVKAENKKWKWEIIWQMYMTNYNF